jgi:hypothetical protein
MVGCLGAVSVALSEIVCCDGISVVDGVRDCRAYTEGWLHRRMARS